MNAPAIRLCTVTTGKSPQTFLSPALALQDINYTPPVEIDDHSNTTLCSVNASFQDKK